MILIADSGSTKTQWIVLKDGSVAATPVTSGLNPVVMEAGLIRKRLQQELTPHLDEAPRQIVFYGAGCGSPQSCGLMADCLAAVTGCTDIEVRSDMLGACRALCGDSPGIVCILGTGSNSCYYDGCEITANVSPLGYILGDEGSGAVLGKTLLADIFKNQLPEKIIADFHKEYPELTRDELITRVYRRPEANRFMASFVPFLARHASHPAIDRLVTDAFLSFFTRNVLSYPEARDRKSVV